jgi:hypothetical protein
MLIYSFDAGCVNMGVCILEYDMSWSKKLTNLKKLITKMLIRIEPGDFNSMKNFIDYFSNVYKILYIDRVNIAGNVNVNKFTNENMIGIAERLKYYLYCLDLNYRSPDVVLVESQFKKNSFSSIVASQLHFYYGKMDTNIICRLNKPNASAESKNNNSCQVHIIGASLKNKINYAKDKKYGDFLLKYSTYVANKKHALHNFKYLCKIYRYELPDLQKKDDISDSYMMARNWIMTKAID